MSRTRNVVQSLTSSRVLYTNEELAKDEYINMKPLPARLGRTNVAYTGYVNDTPWQQQHHHYEDPSAISQLEIPSNSPPRKRNNELYEPTGSLQGRKLFLDLLDKHPRGDVAENAKDACLNRLILFLILAVSVTALALVVLLIMGFIGDTCLCSAQGTKQQLKGTRSEVSLEPVKDQITRLKENITTLYTTLVREMKTTNELKTKLDMALLLIERLQEKTNYTSTADQDLKNLERKIHSTYNKLEEELERRVGLEEKANDTSRKLDKIADETKTLESTMYTRINQTEESLKKIGIALNETVVQQFHAVMHKIIVNSQELRTADQELYRSVMEINKTVIDKVENVSKMIGPIGPRGYNGTQGPQGPPGMNGTRGLQGPSGLNGSQGLGGPQGVQGPAGGGNLSQCEYKQVSSAPSTPDSLATNSVYVAEPSDKRIIGVYCDTDRAALVKMDYLDTGGVRKYSCSCYGDSSYRGLSSTMKCFISYWQCPRYA